MKLTYFIVLPFIFLPSLCNAKGSAAVDGETVKTTINHYFGAKSSLAKTDKKTYAVGDFNGDGIDDIAVLFRPAGNVTDTSQIKISKPWVFPGSKPSKKIYTSLVIINGSADGWMSPTTKVFALIDNSGVLEAPSFELLLRKKSEKGYAQITNMLPVNSNSDIIILPTEAGIDTFVYWDKSSYKLHIPMEIP